MKIDRVIPPVQPRIVMTFTTHEGWAVLMALNDAYAKYPDASARDEWKQWANDLDRELRR